MKSATSVVLVVSSAFVVLSGACAGSRSESGAGTPAVSRSAGEIRAGSPGSPKLEQVLRGRVLTITHACAGCHGGGANPAAEGYLAGSRGVSDEFLIGPCATNPGAQPCFRTRPRNLTPDNATGLGRFSERQIFNALRYGLRPGETADVEITSMVPGQGNFPARPKYLAPPMPWPEWRHMTDQELWDIAAYLKHGVKPVRNRVEDSDGPPDFWASAYSPERIGAYPLPPFPTERERIPEGSTPNR
jgi:mono/diheme cytochrome c family protein